MSKINQTWVFGNYASLDFSAANITTAPNATSGFAINTLEGCASISDINGNLLFYTDGVKVWDNNHILRYSGLNGNSSSTQSSIIVPDPGNSKQYYILTTDGTTGSNVHFDGIRLNISTSPWSIVAISTLMTMPATTGYSSVEKLTAIQDVNCKDFWVITIIQKGNQNISSGPGTFRVFKIDASGIVHVGDTAMNQDVADIGYLKGSSDGKTLAIANGENFNALTYPFDNNTGVINNSVSAVKVIPVPSPPLAKPNGWVYGIEFSPNSKILYFSFMYFNQKGYLYQVDLTQPTLTAILIHTVLLLTGNFAIGALQIGIDNRIYFARHGDVLGAILNPDILGVAANVNDSYIALPAGAFCSLGLPNLLPNPCEHECDCGGCAGCNKDAPKQNEELIKRAKTKYNTVKSKNTCANPFGENCEASAINAQVSLEPCFYFHWGDGVNDQIEEHDTEVFYITVCNPFKDIQYNGLRITKVTLIPNIHPIEKIQIVPDRFISLDCIEPCSCQTREFAMITRATDTGGNYRLEVDYCFESVTLSNLSNSGKVQFDLVITED